MLRKRQIASNADGRRWLITAGWGADGGHRSAAGLHSWQPFPVPYSAMASPRVYLPIASFFYGTDFRPWIGATEPSSRATALPSPPVAARDNLAKHPKTTDAQSDRACGSPGKRQPLQGCQRGKDAPDDPINGPWGDVFETEDEADDTMRSSAEGVPCRSSAMGDDGTHDIPRGSGAGAFATPGVFLSAQGLIVGTSCDNGDDSQERCFWLWDDGVWGEHRVRPETRSSRWN
jgi:hypothetical protein